MVCPKHKRLFFWLTTATICKAQQCLETQINQSLMKSFRQTSLMVAKTIRWKARGELQSIQITVTAPKPTQISLKEPTTRNHTLPDVMQQETHSSTYEVFLPKIWISTWSLSIQLRYQVTGNTGQRGTCETLITKRM